MYQNRSVDIAVIDELAACSTRAAGLLHLLAVAATKGDSAVLQNPTNEEREGIMWLSLDAGMALKAAYDALESSPIEATQPSAESPA